MKRFLVVITALIACVALIISLAITGSDNGAREQGDRVRVCSSVRPAAERGACVAGQPMRVVDTKIVIRTRTVRTPAAGISNIQELVNECRRYADSDASNDAENVATDFGSCLTGVQKVEGLVPSK